MNNDEIYKTLVIDDTHYETRWTRKFAERKSYVPPDARKLVAVIPGVIKGIYVKAGQRVRRGDALVVLEAMKMRNDLASPHDGVIKAIHVTVGQMVAKGGLILELE